MSRELQATDDFYVNITLDNLRLELYNTAGTHFPSDSAHGALALNTRSSWAITYDDQGDRLPPIYKNGQEVAYDTDHTAVTGTYKTLTTPIRVGNDAPGDRPFQGVIDSVRMDDRVLAIDEIKARSASVRHVAASESTE